MEYRNTVCGRRGRDKRVGGEVGEARGGECLTLRTHSTDTEEMDWLPR